MAGKTMFLIRVQPGKEEEFVSRWKKEFDALKQHQGFRARELIRVVNQPGTFVVLSEWESPEDYLAWLHSQDRSRIYDEDLSPLFAAQPISGVGEVIARMG